MGDFDTDVKIDKKNHYGGEQLTFYEKVNIKTHRLGKKRRFL